MYNRDTLVEALAEIKKVCEEFEECPYCPMYSDFYKTCFLEKEKPEGWTISFNTAPWRAII